MNLDCWNYILLHCDIRSFKDLSLVCKSFRNIVLSNNFWKNLVYRDFDNIDNKENDLWFNYYLVKCRDHYIPKIKMEYTFDDDSPLRAFLANY